MSPQELLNRFEVWSNLFSNSVLVEQAIVMGGIAFSCLGFGLSSFRVLQKVRAWRANRKSKALEKRQTAEREAFVKLASKVKDWIVTDIKFYAARAPADELVLDNGWQKEVINSSVNCSGCRIPPEIKEGNSSKPLKG